MAGAAREHLGDDPLPWSPVADLHRAEEVGVLPRGTLEGSPRGRSRVRAGAWSSYGGVVVMHNGPLTPEQEDWVAVLRAGTGAVLAAATAMRMSQVDVPRPPRPQVVIPWWRPALRMVEVDVRRSRIMTAEHVHPTRQPPQFRLARATVDAASLARRPDDVRALLCAPVQQRRVLVRQLRSAVLGVGPVSGRGLMLRTLDDIELGAQSTHELRFVRSLRRAELPQPDRQVWRVLPEGRRCLDCWWDRWRLHVEVDGLGHARIGEWVADLDRHNELVVLDEGRRLRVVGFRLLEREADVMDLVRRALLAAGWRP